MSEKSNLPTQEALDKANSLEILDAEGKPVSFGSILSDDETTVVVFIRHFFCGDYVRDIVNVREDALKNASARIVVIGCGDWQPIAHYKAETGYQGPLYADPSRTLFRALGMDLENLATTPSGEQKKSYLKQGLFMTTVTSIWRGPLKNPSLVGKQGPPSQLGGEFVFKGRSCEFAYRMQHTMDHAEVADVMKAAGVEYP
ncbi:hypothetical protein CONPUDRAFT_87221 [Coniophora puteana RWD-64-598 SS2]|uniref:AhpC-TSA-domain-containing protein n=1 Tax=Coniophora puteana (strain RWD-64-598) TaxID=741705 RepID=A0A5M3N7M3_CONPW|nr:uncharacterized protein CONPUDRAFT_87221 [Coniophora puteana RWD-64-598 SS2]EIW87450.1 hypothetical protein CONPUDRAFT_87221 [Coniophora puteana RWD-64-598 SS2]